MTQGHLRPSRAAVQHEERPVLPAGGAHGWAPEVIGAVGKPQTTPEEYLSVLFASSPSSRKAGQEALGRMYSRTEDRDADTTWAVRQAQDDAVCTWGIPDHAELQRLAGITHPVFVANGDSDPTTGPDRLSARPRESGGAGPAAPASLPGPHGPSRTRC